MSQSALEEFGAYQKALMLFDFVVAYMENLRGDPRCYKLIGQQVGCADSIAANIEEGYGRLSRIEYARFLDIVRGSAREARGRYKRMKHWLKAEVIVQRVALRDEIIGILTASIGTLRSSAGNQQRRSNVVREDIAVYGHDSEHDPDSDKVSVASSPRPPTLDTSARGGPYAAN
jgi:four helix bundle protein